MKDPRSSVIAGASALALVFLAYSGCEDKTSPSTPSSAIPKKYVPFLDSDKERPERPTHPDRF